MNNVTVKPNLAWRNETLYCGNLPLLTLERAEPGFTLNFHAFEDVFREAADTYLRTIFPLATEVKSTKRHLLWSYEEVFQGLHCSLSNGGLEPLKFHWQWIDGWVETEPTHCRGDLFCGRLLLARIEDSDDPEKFPMRFFAFEAMFREKAGDRLDEHGAFRALEDTNPRGCVMKIYRCVLQELEFALQFKAPRG